MAVVVNKLTNANIYVDGQSLLGKAEEFMAPEITAKMTDHKALGMVGSAEFFSGIDKLEAKIKWNSFYSDAFKKAANLQKRINLQVRAQLTSHDATGSSNVPVVCHIGGTYKKFPTGNFKQHDNVEVESTIAVYYYKMIINGETIVEFDVLANLWKVNGVDLLQQYKLDIGQ